MTGQKTNKMKYNNYLRKARLLEVIRVAPASKVDGIVRLEYENVNGLKANLGEMRNWKN